MLFLRALLHHLKRFTVCARKNSVCLFNCDEKLGECMATTTASAGERIDYAATLGSRTKAFILAGVLLGLFLEALDQTIVATALPSIVREFQGIDLLAWVSTGYLLASTALVPIYGKLSDVLGRRTIVVWGISVFLLGSVLCGFAGSMLQLVIFRFIQGIGAAALGSTAFAIPADLYPPSDRARATGLIGGVFGIASVIGPFIGGFLTDGAFFNSNWRWIFYVNIPFGLVALGLILFKMPKLDSGRREQIDWWGTALLLLAVVPLLLGLSLDKALYPWTSPLIIGLFVVAAVATALLILVESRAESPIIALPLFRNRTFALVILLAILMGLAFLPTILFLPIFLVNVVGVSATGAGTALIPQTLAVVAAAVTGANIVQRTGRYKPVILFSLVLALISYALLAFMPADVTSFGVTWRIVLLGLGLGGVVPLLSLIVQNALPHRFTGTATANTQFFQQMGSVVGAAIFGALLSSLLTAHFTARVAPIISQLPPEAAQSIDLNRLRNGGSVGEGAPVEGATGGAPTDLPTQIAQGVQASFARQRELLTAAIQNNDAAARDQLLQNGQTPAQVKTLLGASGGADAGARLNEALQAIDGAEATAVQTAQAQAQATQTAVRDAFATSITGVYRYVIGLVALAFLVTLALPEIPLRKSNTDEPEDETATTASADDRASFRGGAPADDTV